MAIMGSETLEYPFTNRVTGITTIAILGF